MNKEMILEAMYEAIKESIEWGFDEKDYAQFVDGVLAVTEKLLEKSRQKITTTTLQSSDTSTVSKLSTISEEITLLNKDKTFC